MFKIIARKIYKKHSFSIELHPVLNWDQKEIPFYKHLQSKYHTCYSNNNSQVKTKNLYLTLGKSFTRLNCTLDSKILEFNKRYLSLKHMNSNVFSNKTSQLICFISPVFKQRDFIYSCNFQSSNIPPKEVNFPIWNLYVPLKQGRFFETSTFSKLKNRKQNTITREEKDSAQLNSFQLKHQTKMSNYVGNNNLLYRNKKYLNPKMHLIKQEDYMSKNQLETSYLDIRANRNNRPSNELISILLNSIYINSINDRQWSFIGLDKIGSAFKQGLQFCGFDKNIFHGFVRYQFQARNQIELFSFNTRKYCQNLKATPSTHKCTNNSIKLQVSNSLFSNFAYSTINQYSKFESTRLISPKKYKSLQLKYNILSIHNNKRLYHISSKNSINTGNIYEDMDFTHVKCNYFLTHHLPYGHDVQHVSHIHHNDKHLDDHQIQNIQKQYVDQTNKSFIWWTKLSQNEYIDTVNKPEDNSSNIKNPISDTYVCLLLNRPIHERSEYFFQSLWDNAILRVCIDGAFRRYFRLKKGLPPDWVCGDLDSSTWIKDEYTNHQDFIEYEKLGKNVKWRKESEQDSTDLQKGFRLLKDEGFYSENIIIWGSGGRFDHEISNLNSILIETQKSFPTRRIIIIGEENMFEILCPGKHLIYPNLSIESGTCGLVPLSSSAKVFTKGLKWNLNGETLEFGGLISSSNKIDSDRVYVQTDTPLLWISVMKHGMADNF